MSKISEARNKKNNVGKKHQHSLSPKRKEEKNKTEMKLSDFFRSSPLAGIDLARDKSHQRP